MNVQTDFYHILYIFMIYSFVGWIWESCYCSYLSKKWINRGFLLGPWIPIYGCGAVLIYLVLFSFQGNAAVIYLGGLCLATMLEYLTSWIMEKLFNATWWDYRNEKFNINGRVCLKASLAWGFFAVIMVEILHPFVLRMIAHIPHTVGVAAAGLFSVAFSVDLMYTVWTTFDVKKALEKMQKAQEEIRQFIAIHNIGEDYLGGSPEYLLDHMRARWEERKAQLEKRPVKTLIGEYREELEEKLSFLIQSYETNRPKIHRAFQHHLNAYPNFKWNKYRDTFEEVKAYLKTRRKEK